MKLISFIIAIGLLAGLLGCTLPLDSGTSDFVGGAGGSNRPPTETEVPESELPKEPEPVVNYYELRSCAGCHKKIEESDLLGRYKMEEEFILRFKAAVGPVGSGGIPSMQGREVLMNELQAIAKMLIKEQQTPSEASGVKVSYSVPLGTRRYLASQIESMFPSATTLATFKAIQSNAMVLGGACTRYDGGCEAKEVNHDLYVNSSQTPQYHASRAGYALNFCAEILSSDEALQTLLAKAALSTTTEATEVSLLKLYDLFFPYVAPEGKVRGNLALLYSAARNSGLSIQESWRISALPLCEAFALGAL